MKLYGFPTPRNACVWAMIEYLQLAVEAVPIDLRQGQQKTPAYLALNPNGLTPTLVDSDFILWEHAAILQYLAETAGSTLAPSDPRQRAEATRWISWIQMHWVPGADILGFECLAKPALGLGEPDADEIQRGQSLMAARVPILDQHLSRAHYMLGEHLSFVDFFVAGSIAYWQTCQMPLQATAHVLQWYAQLEGLPAWQAQFA